MAGVFLYLTIGVGVMYIRGARGQELIPNIEFWKDLPQLVKVNIFYYNLSVKNTCFGSCRQAVYNFIRSGALVPFPNFIAGWMLVCSFSMLSQISSISVCRVT